MAAQNAHGRTGNCIPQPHRFVVSGGGEQTSLRAEGHPAHGTGAADKNASGPDRPFYSGKHKKHGMNLQVIASPHGDILWVSGAPPGSVHDKKAEWVWCVLGELEEQGLVTLADKGYQGSTWAKARTRRRTSRSRRKRPTAPTRSSAPR